MTISVSAQNRSFRAGGGNRSTGLTEHLDNPAQYALTPTERFMEPTRQDFHAPIILPSVSYNSMKPAELTGLDYDEYVELRVARGKQIGLIIGIILVYLNLPLASFMHASISRYGFLNNDYDPGILSYVIDVIGLVGVLWLARKLYRSNKSVLAKARISHTFFSLSSYERRELKSRQSKTWREIAPNFAQITTAFCLVTINLLLAIAHSGQWKSWQINTVCILPIILAIWAAWLIRKIFGKLYEGQACRKILVRT